MDQQVQQDLKQQIKKIIEVLQNDLGTIRTGRATPSLVESVVVSVYAGTTRLKIMELATVGVSDTQTIVITPFDQSIIEEIRKGIQEANIGMNPVVDSHIIRINIPPLSLERRQELIKIMNHKLENGKIMIRQIRQKSMGDLKNMKLPEDDEKRLEKEIQKVIDDTIADVEGMGKAKEAELMQI
jgi:ribosome recycling factor